MLIWTLFWLVDKTTILRMSDFALWYSSCFFQVLCVLEWLSRWRVQVVLSTSLRIYCLYSLTESRVQCIFINWEWKFSEINNVLTHNLLTCRVSSVLITSCGRCLSPWTTTVLPRLHFKVSSSGNHAMYLLLECYKSQPFLRERATIKFSWMETFCLMEVELTEETSQIFLSISVSIKLKLPSRNYFKVLITLTTILSCHR